MQDLRAAQENLREHLGDSEALIELADSPGWQVLIATFNEVKRRYYEALTANLMAGKKLDDAKLNYNRGVFDALDKVLATPGKAVQRLQRAYEELQDLEQLLKEDDQQ